MYNIILTVSSIKMQTEYWCKLFYFVLSAVGKRVMRPAFRQASVLIHVHYKIVGYLDPPIQCVKQDLSQFKRLQIHHNLNHLIYD